MMPSSRLVYNAYDVLGLKLHVNTEDVQNAYPRSDVEEHSVNEIFYRSATLRLIDPFVRDENAKRIKEQEEEDPDTLPFYPLTTFYEMLGNVDQTSTELQIMDVYIKLHSLFPVGKIKYLDQAIGILCDPVKKAAYDEEIDLNVEKDFNPYFYPSSPISVTKEQYQAALLALYESKDTNQLRAAKEKMRRLTGSLSPNTIKYLHMISTKNSPLTESSDKAEPPLDKYTLADLESNKHKLIGALPHAAIALIYIIKYKTLLSKCISGKDTQGKSSAEVTFESFIKDLPKAAIAIMDYTLSLLESNKLENLSAAGARIREAIKDLSLNEIITLHITASAILRQKYDDEKYKKILSLSLPHVAIAIIYHQKLLAIFGEFYKTEANCNKVFTVSEEFQKFEEDIDQKVIDIIIYKISLDTLYKNSDEETIRSCQSLIRLITQNLRADQIIKLHRDVTAILVSADDTLRLWAKPPLDYTEVAIAKKNIRISPMLETVLPADALKKIMYEAALVCLYKSSDEGTILLARNMIRSITQNLSQDSIVILHRDVTATLVENDDIVRLWTKPSPDTEAAIAKKNIRILPMLQKNLPADALKKIMYEAALVCLYKSSDEGTIRDASELIRSITQDMSPDSIVKLHKEVSDILEQRRTGLTRNWAKPVLDYTEAHIAKENIRILPMLQTVLKPDIIKKIYEYTKASLERFADAISLSLSTVAARSTILPRARQVAADFWASASFDAEQVSADRLVRYNFDDKVFPRCKEALIVDVSSFHASDSLTHDEIEKDEIEEYYITDEEEAALQQIRYVQQKEMLRRRTPQPLVEVTGSRADILEAQRRLDDLRRQLNHTHQR